jgi:gamma-glutamylcyclotransferase
VKIGHIHVALTDKVEGYPSHYDRIKLKVETDEGKYTEAEVYKAQPDYIGNGLKLSKNYMKHLLAAKDIISDRYYKSLETNKTLDY